MVNGKENVRFERGGIKPFVFASLQLCIFFLCFINYLNTPAFSLELDASIDDEIRKNYDPSKLEQDMALPALPRIIDAETSFPIANKKSAAKAVNPSRPEVQTQQKKITATYQHNNSMPSNTSCITLKKGTKVEAKLLSNISDRSRRGTKVKFVSTYPVTTTYFTIPMGTYFYGQITESHKPQLSGNGGLIVINITSVVLNGEVQPINAYVSKANYKRIFYNNIKGKRKYWISTIKSTKNGRHFFGKMIRLTGTLATDGSSIVVAPFSLCAGLITVGSSIIIAPVLGLFNKGDSIAFNSGTDFVIKLSQDIFLCD